MTEVARLLRHVVPPLVAYAVGSGLVPKELQQPLTELALVTGSVVVALAASWKRDKRR